MKFKVDENLPQEVAADLRTAGHEADTVTSEGLAGASDENVLAVVKAVKRAILTLDKGIADIRKYPPAEYAGIILFRPGSMGRDAVLAFVRKYLPSLLQADLTGHLYVVSDSGSYDLLTSNRRV